MLAWEPTEAEEEEKASDFSPLLYILPPGEQRQPASYLLPSETKAEDITPIPSAFFLEAQLTNECLKAQVAFLCTH